MQQSDPGTQASPIEQARHQAEVVRARVQDAIALAEEQGGPFDFLSLAIAAHCSVAYLRQHREFATQIRALQATVPHDPADDRNRVLRDRVAGAEQEVRALRGEVDRLEAENARLRDRMARWVSAANAPRLSTGVRRPGALPRT